MRNESTEYDFYKMSLHIYLVNEKDIEKCAQTKLKRNEGL